MDEDVTDQTAGAPQSGPAAAAGGGTVIEMSRRIERVIVDECIGPATTAVAEIRRQSGVARAEFVLSLIHISEPTRPY